MPKPLYVLLFILLIDAIGLGLIMPILPGLLASLSQDPAHNSLHYGVLLALYALMQFVCAPVLGALSDRYGRRRVLLLSLAGAALDYVLMAYAPTLGWFYLGRVVAGITGANMAVATAYLTDITPQAQRAARFGQMGAAVGLGMIAGPVLGGWLGDGWLRSPFWLAAALNGISLLLVWRVLPESRRAEGDDAQQRPSLNAFAAFKRLQGSAGLLPLVCLFGVLALGGQWPGSLWILYGLDRFGWSPWVAGLSLAGYGLCHALAQAFAIGPLVARLGETRALLLGLACDALGLLLLAFAVSGWEPFALLPLFAAGGMAVPALQSMMTRLVSDAHQGALQGTLASMASLAGVIGPLLVTGLYTVGQGLWPGLIWVLGATIYLLALPLLQRYRRSSGGQAAG
ncbi:MAG: Tet(A)/Tet(B)/Tet(C) family tetracycline efflux MFS transporter [Acidovorax sp.]|jgi:DHA1 family tetracycline resistance protein-like MFS transporter|nr:Tet(A)/Tet(B)/Tet(C) family tetracycline efflux MFS transporter [Acidovorax sp.]